MHIPIGKYCIQEGAFSTVVSTKHAYDYLSVHQLLSDLFHLVSLLQQIGVVVYQSLP